MTVASRSPDGSASRRIRQSRGRHPEPSHPKATGLDAEKQKASAPLIGRSLPFMNDATSYLLVLTN